jgi:hypothetical protein
MDEEWKKISPISNKTFQWNDDQLIERLEILSKSTEPIDQDPLYLMLLTMSLCHSANVFDKHDEENTGKLSSYFLIWY